MIEEQLIKRCIEKDRRAQLELHKICFHLLMPVCYKYVKQEELARELFNQAFLKILSSLQKYDQHKDFKKWSQSIAINTLIDEYRKNKRIKMMVDNNCDLDSYLFINQTGENNNAQQTLGEETVKQLLEKLPNVSRKVFQLFALEGFSHHEISEMLQISTGTSKWHVSNAREILKKYISQLL